VDEAFRAYRETDCDLRGLNLEIANVALVRQELENALVRSQACRSELGG